MKSEDLNEDEQAASSISRLLFKNSLAAYSFQRATSLSNLPAKRSYASSNTNGNETGSSLPSSSATPIPKSELVNKRAKLSSPTHSERPSKGKSRQVKRGIAPEEKYSHLKPLVDYLGPNLDSNTSPFYFFLAASLTLTSSCDLRNKVRFMFH
jgi:hypothetical protein